MLGFTTGWPVEVQTAATISEQCGFAIAILAGPDFRLHANEACRKLNGYSGQTMAEHPCSAAWPDLWERFEQDFERVFRSGTGCVVSGKLNTHGSSRSECHLEVSIAPIAGPSATSGLFCIIHESTASVLAARRLSTIRELADLEPLDEDTASLPGHIARTIATHREDISFAAIYRLRHDDFHLLGFEGLSEEDAQPRNWPLREAIEDRQNGIPENRTNDGVLTYAFRHTGADTARVLLLGLNACDSSSDVFREFTHLLCLQVEHIMALVDLQESTKIILDQSRDLRRSNEELERFAFTASHDLQEPLRTVIAFTQLLARRQTGKNTPEDDENVTYILEAANRMSKLISGLLEYSRIGSNLSVNPQPVDMNKVVGDACSNLNFAMRDSGAELTNTDLPVVTGDHTLLTQLIQNLISNAIKYRKTGQPPLMHFSAQQRADHWLFSLSDNGIGFEQEYSETIFGVFKRLHGRKFPGTGIGLAICRKIVERHGGMIWAESSEGAGATFRFTLPASH